MTKRERQALYDAAEAIDKNEFFYIRDAILMCWDNHGESISLYCRLMAFFDWRAYHAMSNTDLYMRMSEAERKEVQVLMLLTFAEVGK